MFSLERLMVATIPSFVSAKVAQPRLPSPFFVACGDFFNDRLVTFFILSKTQVMSLARRSNRGLSFYGMWLPVKKFAALKDSPTR